MAAEQKGVTLSELGQLLTQHFDPPKTARRKKRPDSIYVQALVPTVDCDQLSIDNLLDTSSLSQAGSSISEQIKLLLQYALRNTSQLTAAANERSPGVVDKKGKLTARARAAKIRELRLEKARQEQLRLAQRITRRVLCSQTVVKTVLKATGCKYLYGVSCKSRRSVLKSS